MCSNDSVAILMVVAQYPYPVTGGLEKQAHELSKLLITKDVKVTVLSRKFSEGQQEIEDVDGVTVFRIAWSKIRLIRFITLPFLITYFMLRKIKHYKIVHLHTLSPFSLYILLIAKLFGKKVVLKMANVAEFGLPPLKKTVLGLLQLKIVKSADVIVSMSLESKQELTGVGYPINRIFMTPNGIPIFNESNTSNKNSLNSDKNCRVVFVGRLAFQKNIASLLNVWADVQSRHDIFASLEICGTGPLEEELRETVLRLDISDTVIFRGHIDNVYEHLSAADIFVLPSFAEGNSNAILEAMVIGLPIVSTNVGGTLMQVGCHGAEYISEVGSNSELFKNLLSLISNSSERDRVGQEMYERVRANFSMEDITNNYISLYSYILSNKADSVSEISHKVFD
jgi:glycosyltransferase involved in cell wall biosynthesis